MINKSHGKKAAHCENYTQRNPKCERMQWNIILCCSFNLKIVEFSFRAVHGAYDLIRLGFKSVEDPFISCCYLTFEH